MKQEPRFIKQLLDTNFDHFITRKVAKVFYIVWIVLLVAFTALTLLAGLFLIISGQAQGIEVPVTVLAIVTAPLVSFFLLILIRLAFETSIALVLIAENTRPTIRDNKVSHSSLGGDEDSHPTS
jgi:hypothetical protein